MFPVSGPVEYLLNNDNKFADESHLISRTQVLAYVFSQYISLDHVIRRPAVACLVLAEQGVV